MEKSEATFFRHKKTETSVILENMMVEGKLSHPRQNVRNGRLK
jgi:hypothetical protein